VKKTLIKILTLHAILIIIILQNGCKKSNTILIPVQQQGKIIYLSYVTTLDTIAIWTANYDGSGSTRVKVALPPNLQLFFEAQPKVSSDHKTFYFVGYLNNGSNSKSILFSCNIDGSNLKEIISGDAYSNFMIGDTYEKGQQGKILYSQTLNNSLGIWTANSDGTNAQKINFTLPIEFSLLGFPKISADGTTLFFVTGRSFYNNYASYIFKYNIATGSADSLLMGNENTNIANSSIALGRVYTSGQNDYILYLKESLNNEIWIANLDGTGAKEINLNLPSGFSVWSYAPTASPDGKTIFFVAGQYSNLLSIYSCNNDGSNIHLVIPAINSNNIAVIGDAF